MQTFTSFLTYVFIVSTRLKLLEASDRNRCVAIMSPDIEYCKRHGHPNIKPRDCEDDNVCMKNFNATVIVLEPHSSIIIPDMLEHLLAMCCGPCSKVGVLSCVH